MHMGICHCFFLSYEAFIFQTILNYYSGNMKVNTQTLLFASLLRFTNAMAIDKRDGPAPSNVQQFASQLEASKLGGQYSKPTQVVDQFLAIGDSYTAGIGSNGQDDRDPQSYDCRRYKGAYPYILLEDNGWDELNGYSPKSPLLNFGACSGATMDDLLSKQLTLGEEWRDVSF